MLIIVTMLTQWINAATSFSQDTTLKYCYVNVDSALSLLADYIILREQVLYDSAYRTYLPVKEMQLTVRRQLLLTDFTDEKMKELKRQDSMLTAQLVILEQLISGSQKKIEDYHMNLMPGKKMALIASIKELYGGREGCDFIIDTSSMIVNNGPGGRTITDAIIKALKK